MSAEDLQALLDLQAVDTSIDQHEHRRAALAERAAVSELEQKIATGRTALEAATAVQADVGGRQEALENELSVTERRSKEVSRRLYGGEVSASRELQAMSDELDSLKARASNLEDQLLEMLEAREPVDKLVEEQKSELSRLDGQLNAAASSLNAAEAVIDSEVAVLREQRSIAASRVPGPVLQEYERLRSRLGGVAVSRLAGNRCDGCHLTLPATELDRFRHLPPGEMVTCDQCGRILVPGN